MVFSSHEPRPAFAGGADGMDIVSLADAGAHPSPHVAELLGEIGRGRAILDKDFPDKDFLWLDTAESSGEVFWITAEGLRE